MELTRKIVQEYKDNVTLNIDKAAEREGLTKQ